MRMSVGYYDAVQDEAIGLLYARLDDLCDRAARGTVAISAFLTPREAMYASRHLSSRIAAGTACLFGGFAYAERCRAVILPDYLEGMTDADALSADPVAALEAIGFSELAGEVRDAVTMLCIRGSGYRTLTHRDYLGSVLGLGVERDAVGDVLVDPEAESPTAYLVTDARMAEFLLTDLCRVATDTVKVSRLPAGATVSVERRRAPIHDTVASPRLDCVVAALCNLSREAAQNAIRGGLVELNYEPVADCDRTVEPPATLSVRGVGKFSVEDISGETRKGRIRLTAAKYL